MKTRIIHLVYLFIIIFILINCQSSNHSFVLPQPYDLILNQTTIKDIASKYGNPNTIYKKLMNGKMVVILNYYKANYSVWNGDYFGDKFMLFFFYNNLLCGYLMNDMFEEQQHNIYESKFALIEEGKTNKNDIHNLFSKPNGIFIYPAIKEDSDVFDKEWHYIFRKYDTYQKYILKNLIVYLDSNSVVKKIDYFTRIN